MIKLSCGSEAPSEEKKVVEVKHLAKICFMHCHLPIVGQIFLKNYIVFIRAFYLKGVVQGLDTW